MLVTNTGKRLASLSVLLKVRPVPAGSLVGGNIDAFEKVRVEPNGGTAKATLRLSATGVALYSDAHGKQRARRGLWEWFIEDKVAGISVGGQFTIA